MSRKGNDELKELRAIRNLLILSLLKDGATSEEINLATKMGAGNIRAMFPRVKTKGRGIRTKATEETKVDFSKEEIAEDKQKDSEPKEMPAEGEEKDRKESESVNEPK